jgi:hypothetical protein
MAAITPTDVRLRRDALMAAAERLSVIVSNGDPGTDDVACYRIKDPDPAPVGLGPNAVADEPGNALGGQAGEGSWKSFSYSDAGTAYL